MVIFNKQTRLKNFIKGISVVLIYFIVSFFRTVPLSLLNIDYNTLSTFAKEFYNIATEVALLGIIFIIFSEQYKKAWDDLKQNHRKYFSDNLKFYLRGVILMMGANALIAVLGGSMSENESSIRDQFAIAPIYTYISAVFLAPILEESVFRLSFRNMFENNFLFIVISGLVFGGLHLISGVNMELFFLYVISYCSFGIIFAYMLTKTNNIFVSMGFHLMHNGILMSLQVFLLLFG